MQFLTKPNTQYENSAMRGVLLSLQKVATTCQQAEHWQRISSTATLPESSQTETQIVPAWTYDSEDFLFQAQSNVT